MEKRSFSDRLRIAARERTSERSFWLNKLSGEWTKSIFPYDYKKNESEYQYVENSIPFRFPGEIVSSLLKLSTGSDAKLHIILVTGLVVLLHKYNFTGSRDIITGVPVYKQHTREEYINTVLAIRTLWEKNITFKELLFKVREAVVEAVENQNYPIEILVEELNMSFSQDDFPLFDTVIQLENIHESKYTQHILPNLTFSLVRRDKSIAGVVKYNSLRYKETTIRRIIEHFNQLFRGVPDSTGINRDISAVDILTEQEKKQLLADFNCTDEEFTGPQVVHWWFENQVEMTPDNIAVIERGRGGSGNIFLTYRELNKKANRSAWLLRSKGVAAGSIVGILMYRSIDMVGGMLAILKAGGAYIPIDTGYPGKRIRYILEDSESRLLLSHSSAAQILPFKDIASNREKDNARLKAVHREVVLVDLLGEELAGSPVHNPPHVNCPDDLLYVISTSGSTGKPKGVMFAHRNMVNLLHWGFTGTDIRFSRVLQFASIGFDASAQEIFCTFLSGGELYLITEGLRSDLPQLFDYIHRNYINVAFLPPAFLRYIFSDPRYSEGFPRCIRYISAAGEQLIVNEGFRQYLQENRVVLYNFYGPAETHVVTALRIDPAGHIVERPSIGYPVSNTRIYILDEALGLKPIGGLGELYIAGANVGPGYYKKEALTKKRFIADPFGEGGRMYRTGDLARRLPDGSIEFVGRVDQQVKIRSYRIEPEEISRTLEEIDGVKEAVVIDRTDDNGDKYLCAYLVPVSQGALEIDSVRKVLASRLPDYMVPAYFIELEKIPLSLHGKTDRRALPLPTVQARAEFTAPEGEIETRLLAMWSDLLSLEPGLISANANFFELGGHSLKATVLIARIHRELKVKITLGDMFDTPTIRGLAKKIEKAPGDRLDSIGLAEKKYFYPLSSAQRRLYIVQQMDPGSTGYNLSEVLRLEGNVDKEKFRETFKKLIDRHESLRTSFEMVENRPVQRIRENLEFEIEYSEPSLEVKAIIKNFFRPFDLSRPPLLRVGLIKEKKETYIFMLDMHHIITDGTSMRLFVEEFMALYSGASLPPPNIQYKDYAEWRESEKEKEKMKQQETYWLKQFEEEIPVLDLPIDYPRPAVRDFEGNDCCFEIAEEQTRALERCAGEEGATLYMVLLSVYNIFLSRVCSREDIVVGTPAVGRRHPDLLRTIGMFVNMLPLWNEPRDEKTFKEFLAEVKEKTLQAFENQDYPFEELVDKAAVPRDTGRNPLFETVFALQDKEMAAVLKPQIGDLRLKKYGYESKVAKFDLMLEGKESNGKLTFRFEYCTKLFKKETIQRFIRYFETVIASIAAETALKLADIEIIPEEEKRQLLHTFNAAASEYPRNKTIHQLFEEQALRTPDAAALHMSYRSDKTYMTYSQLNRSADQVAGLLNRKGVRPDTAVGFLVERSIEMIIGILGILKAGGAYLPIDPDYPGKRIDYMLKDSSVNVLVTTGQAAEEGETLRKWDGETYYMETLLNDSNPAAFSSFHLPRPQSLAYIMYTSGSTGSPKGVMVTHRNVVRLVKNTNFVPLSEETRILQTGAPVFDATTFEIWGSLLNGGRLVLVDNEVILDARRLGRALKVCGVNTLWLSSSLFNRLLQQDINLFEPLNYLLVGGDVLAPEHINRLKREFPHLAIINGYGPTENTTFSTTHLIEKEFESSIPIGKPISNSTAYIFDRHRRLQPVGVWGELWVGGDGVARGYLNNPDLTAERFCGSYKSYRTYILYKTGDLVRRLPDGSIEFKGRMDRQVKIRGFRIETGEIETLLLKHNTVKETVVIDSVHGGEKCLSAYIVPLDIDTFDMEVLRTYLSDRLPAYMVPSFFVVLDRIPLNPNGKVDRKALPAPGAEVSEGDLNIPGDWVEVKLAGLWKEALHLSSDIVVTIDNDFFRLGGHSLTAAALIAQIHKAFDVKVPLAEVFKRPTLRELAGYISAKVQYRSEIVGRHADHFRAIAPVEKKEYYVLSSAQRRLYILQQMEPGNTVYNIPILLESAVMPGIEKLERTFKRLISRHESLRTSFHSIAGEPVQRIHEDAAFSIEYNPGIESFEFIRPFDLSQAPLLRVGLGKMGTDRYLLVIDMHHIISDGSSMPLLVHELTALYEEKALPELQVQYKDYTHWQAAEGEKEWMKSQELWWLEMLSGDIPLLDLPVDFPRPPQQQFEGSRMEFRLESEETRKLKALAASEGATLYMVLLAVYNVLLAKLSGLEEVVVGTPVAARRHADLQAIMGMFVNTLVMRNFPSGDKSFIDFLREVKDNVLTAFENQDYPFEDLVERVEVRRDLGRNPLFDVFFSLQNFDIPEIRVPGLELRPCAYENRTSKFDLMLHGSEANGTLTFEFEYCTKLFKEETIQRFVRYFETVTASLTAETALKLADIEIIPEEENRQLLHTFNAAVSEYPRDKTIHHLFEEQALRTPDAAALYMSYRTYKTDMTYSQLNRSADQVAGLLNQKGVHPDTAVGLLVERSIEMIVGILGILKAGGAYLPIDPDYPEERINYMLVDSGVKILLTDSPEAHRFNCLLSIVNLQLPMRAALPPPPQHTHPTPPTHLCYIIYTSGSTGIPKGVMVEHKSVVNLLTALQEAYPFTGSDTYLLKTSYMFDVSVTELFGWFFGGGRLGLLEKGGEKDPGVILDTIETLGITHINFVPSMFNAFVGALPPRAVPKLSSLKYIFLAGEAILPELLNEFRRLNLAVQLENIYGPTEGTVYSSRYSLAHWDGIGSIPIGKPMPNTRLYILDKGDRLQPIGVPGELCISGTCLARGYLNKPELTAEKFKFNRSYIFYKTGDRARWLPGGDIEFLGRMDHQVKIRGFRVELGEIESRLLRQDEISEAVVMYRDGEKGDKYLCAYIIAAGEIDIPGLKGCLSRELPEYMLPSHVVHLEHMPLTGSGKIDRNALPAPGMKIGETYIAPRNRMEEKLAEIWQDALGIEKEKISIDDNFFQLGGHSLKAIQVAARLSKELNVQASIAKIFNSPTIRAMSEVIKKLRESKYAAVEPVEEKEYYPLSSAQKRLYILHQMDKTNTRYNMPMYLVLEGDVDKDRLEESFRQLIKRHEILRTSFIMPEDEPLQEIHKDAAFKMEYDEGEEEEQEIIKRFLRPFDLSRAPLLRSGLIKTGHNRYVWIVDMYHIVSDGFSSNLLIEEFMLLYDGEALPPLKLQYKDFSQWQNRMLTSVEVEKQETYWLTRFQGKLPGLKLPTDFPDASAHRLDEGEYARFELEKELVGELYGAVNETGATVYMFLLAVFNILLSRYTKQEDIVVGAPVAGRRNVELEKIIGMFVNMLAMRNAPRDAKTFDRFLYEVRQNALDAYENQDYQFETLVKKLGIVTHAGNPLCNVVFVLQKVDRKNKNMKGIEITLHPFVDKTVKFDLQLEIIEGDNRISMVWNYPVALFRRSSVDKMAHHYIEILGQVLENRGIKLRDILISHDLAAADTKILQEGNVSFGF